MTARTLLATACLAALAGCSQKEEPPAAQGPLPIAEPGALAVDTAGGLYVADRALHRVVRIDVASRRREIAVEGLRDIVALAFDDSRRLYVGASERIYRTGDAEPTVVAGNGKRAHEGDLGPATEASLAGAVGFEVDHDETIVIAEYDNFVRLVHPDGVIETLAGIGEAGYTGDGGPARQARVAHPHDVAIRRNGVVVADSHNGVLRLVHDRGFIETLARGFDAPIVVEGGPGDSLYVADGSQNAIFRLAPGERRPERIASAEAPAGLAVDGEGNVYVSELGGEKRVLQVAPGGATRVLVP